MTNDNANILLVCYANYCRSPVAEKILKKLNVNKGYKISSAGIEPYDYSNMDSRSSKFLKSKGFEDSNHFPRKLNLDIVKTSDLIFAMDPKLLFLMNNMYKKYQSKIHLFIATDRKINLSDPFKFDEVKYNIIMNNIEIICNELDLDKYF